MAKLTETPMRANKPQPSVSLSEDDLPEIKGWKVGSKYYIVLEVEQTRLSKGDIFMDEKDRKYEASFKILSAKVADKDYESEDTEEADASNPGKMKMQVMKEKMKKMDQDESDEE